MTEPDHDEWLFDLELQARRLPARQAEPDPEPAKTRSVPDADQGMRGLAPTATKKRSPDAWLVELTDLGRHGPGGVADPDYYDNTFGF
jgi:hypothetical protein